MVLSLEIRKYWWASCRERIMCVSSHLSHPLPSHLISKLFMVWVINLLQYILEKHTQKTKSWWFQVFIGALIHMTAWELRCGTWDWGRRILRWRPICPGSSCLWKLGEGYSSVIVLPRWVRTCLQSPALKKYRKQLSMAFLQVPMTCAGKFLAQSVMLLYWCVHFRLI